MEFIFIPTQEFEWVKDDGVLMGQYHPTMTYNCTKEPRHNELRAECEMWAREGKITIIPLSGGEVFKTIEGAS